MVPLFLTLGLDRSDRLHAPTALRSGKQPPIPIVEEAE
jgi:hypothetical protein